MNRTVIGINLVTLGLASALAFVGVAGGIMPDYRTLWNLRHATVGVYSVETTTLKSSEEVSDLMLRLGPEFSVDDMSETKQHYTFFKPSSCIQNSLYAEASACARPVAETPLALALALSTVLVGLGSAALLRRS